MTAPARGIAVLGLVVLNGCTHLQTAVEDGWRGSAAREVQLSVDETTDIYRVALQGMRVELAGDSAGGAPVLDPRILPEHVEGSFTSRHAPELLASLVENGVVAALCEPRSEYVCVVPGQSPDSAWGAVVLSKVYRTGRGVSVYVLSYAQSGTPPWGGTPPRFAVEVRFDLRRQGGRWTVVRHEEMMVT